MITFIYFLFTVGVYVYLALCLYKMAEKTATPNAWLAWIPILSIFTTLGVAKKPYWWFILFLIPIVNIVIGIVVTIAMVQSLGRPKSWGITLVVVGILGAILTPVSTVIATILGYSTWVVYFVSYLPMVLALIITLIMFGIMAFGENPTAAAAPPSQPPPAAPPSA